jgi:hypothetical protein
MLELLMTALRSGKVPTVIPQQAENIPNLHDHNNVRRWDAFGQFRGCDPNRAQERSQATLAEA